MNPLPRLMAAAALAVVATAPSHAQDLGAFSEFSVIVSGNITSARDVEGRTLVGGDYASPHAANFAINMPSSVPGSESTLIVQGDILNGSWLNIQQGSVEVGGTVDRGINYNGGGSTILNPGVDYNHVFATLDSSSGALRDISANSVVIIPSGQPSGLKFVADESVTGTAVFHVNAADLFSNHAVQSMDIIANNASEILINVSGTSVNWNTGANLLGTFNDSYWRSRIVWNFHEATDIYLEAKNMMGQVLAPNATVTTYGNIDGSVYARNLQSNGEVHYPGYAGSFTQVPEPASACLGGLGLLLLFRRRR